MVRTEYHSVDRHVVQFYGHDEELAERVAGYLLGALQDDGVAIVIATPEHRREFEARLEKSGVDLTAARESGDYLAMDASETVRAFVASERPGQGLDRGAFDRVVGRVIRQAGAGGRPVRAFAEMVALLWDHGLVNAAAQVETMWDELARRSSFSMFCGYRADSVTRDGNLDVFAELCRLHREVVGSSPPGVAGSGAPGAVRTFALSRDTPAEARHFAVDALHRWGISDLADDTALVVTELAANAVRHARSGFTVVLSCRPGIVRISVRDASPLPPSDGGPALPARPLHGLGAVNAMAHRWGVESLGSAGKTVWVELSR